MSKPIPKSDMDVAASSGPSPMPVSLRRKVLLYTTPFVSGAALIAVIYFLRLDIFKEWEKSLMDLLMVAVAVTFFVSLYMAVDAIVRRPESHESTRPKG